MFPGYFEGMWEYYTSMPDVEIEKTIDGFKELKVRLERIYTEHEKRNLNIAAKHTEIFINVVNKLIEMEKGKVEDSLD